MRKTQKICEGCRLDQGARFRTLASLYLCSECYRVWLKTGVVPGPKIEEDQRTEVRW